MLTLSEMVDSCEMWKIPFRFKAPWEQVAVFVETVNKEHFNFVYLYIEFKKKNIFE